MKKCLFLAIPVIIFLTGCATSTATPPSNSVPPKQLTQEQTTSKNPMRIKLYTKNTQPTKPYVVLGTETVSKFNYVGIKRQKAHIQDVMRNLAANIGGDAVIDIKDQQTSISGTIIAFKNTSKPQG